VLGTVLTKLPHQLYYETYPQPPKPHKPQGESSYALRSPGTGKLAPNANCVSPPRLCVNLSFPPSVSVKPLFGPDTGITSPLPCFFATRNNFFHPGQLFFAAAALLN